MRSQNTRYPGPCSQTSEKGFTLLEFLLVVVIIGITLSMAAPSFYPLIQSYRIADTINAIERGLRLARQESVVNNQSVVICPSANGLHCSADQNWSNGFITFIDFDKDGQKQSGETNVYSYLITRPVNVRFNRSRRLSFNGLGRASSNGTFTVCDPQSKVATSRLTLVHSGRMRRSSALAGCA